MKWVDRLISAFGGIPFLIVYNVVTVWWFLEGKYDHRFFDPFPSNFYTFLVSWLAINMSALILLAELRKAKAEAADEDHKRKTLEAILRLAESMEQLLKKE